MKSSRLFILFAIIPFGLFAQSFNPEKMLIDSRVAPLVGRQTFSLSTSYFSTAGNESPKVIEASIEALVKRKFEKEGINCGPPRNDRGHEEHATVKIRIDTLVIPNSKGELFTKTEVTLEVLSAMIHPITKEEILLPVWTDRLTLYPRNENVVPYDVVSEMVDSLLKDLIRASLR